MREYKLNVCSWGFNSIKFMRSIAFLLIRAPRFQFATKDI